MDHWTLETNNSSLWNAKLMEFDGVTIFQSWQWGEYKQQFGWEPVRALSNEAMVQGLLRRYPMSTGLMWCPGGGVGDISCFNPEFLSFLTKKLSLSRLYLRMGFLRRKNQELETLKADNWRAVKTFLGAKQSILIDLSSGELKRKDQLSSNWRHNLKRSEKQSLTFGIWKNPPLEEVIKVYRVMESFKDLPVQYSEKELSQMFHHLQSHLHFVYAMDVKGQIIGFRAATIFANKAWDFFAATSVEGRKTYASYGLLWRLWNLCEELGATSYDMAGVDPMGNLGVYNFKKGSGGELIEYLGEWELATSHLLRWGVDLAIASKGRNLN